MPVSCQQSLLKQNSLPAITALTLQGGACTKASLNNSSPKRLSSTGIHTLQKSSILDWHKQRTDPTFLIWINYFSRQRKIILLRILYVQGNVILWTLKELSETINKWSFKSWLMKFILLHSGQKNNANVQKLKRPKENEDDVCKLRGRWSADDQWF